MKKNFKKGLALFLLGACCLSVHFAYKKQETLSLWWALQASPPQWAKEQITQDLAPFSSTGISQEALDQTFSKIQEQKIPAFRYRICNNQIFRKPEEDHAGRAGTYDKMLKRLQKSTSLPNVDFILCVMDGVPEAYVPSRFWITEPQAPLLCWAKKKEAPNLVLVPDFLTTRESGWQWDITAVNTKYHSIPWEKRIPKAFWRGTASDKTYTPENYAEKPRFLLSLLSQKNQELVDAGFCKAPQEVSHILAGLQMLVGHTSVSDHLTYKYLPVLDGWMCTFPGFQWRLLSGSLALKQESDEVQYFYGALKPYVHYLPIQRDMSDLIEKIYWAQNHDQECKVIAQNARTFALQNLMPNQIYSYLYWVLKDYAALQTFDQLEIDSTWKKI